MGIGCSLLPQGGLAEPPAGDVHGLEGEKDGPVPGRRSRAGGSNEQVRNGNIGNIGIVTGTAESAIVVPTSAVSLDGTSHTVTVVNDDATLTTLTVQVGVVGGTWTGIISGDLSIGQQVVLADLDEPLPGSATEVAETEGFQVQGGSRPMGDSRPATLVGAGPGQDFHGPVCVTSVARPGRVV